MTQSEGFDQRGRRAGNSMEHEQANYRCPCRDCVHLRVLEWSIKSHPGFANH